MRLDGGSGTAGTTTADKPPFAPMPLHASGGFVWPSMRHRQTVQQAIATSAVALGNRWLHGQSSIRRFDGRQVSGIFRGSSKPSLNDGLFQIAGQRPPWGPFRNGIVFGALSYLHDWQGPTESPMIDAMPKVFIHR